jgi:hypothetical protein
MWNINGTAVGILVCEKGRIFPKIQYICSGVVEMYCVQDYCYVALKGLFHVLAGVTSENNTPGKHPVPILQEDGWAP